MEHEYLDYHLSLNLVDGSRGHHLLLSGLLSCDCRAFLCFPTCLANILYSLGLDDRFHPHHTMHLHSGGLTVVQSLVNTNNNEY